MSVAICTGEGTRGAHAPLLLFAGSPNLEIAVQAEQGPDGYSLTNFYADGIRGVSDADRVEADCDDQPMCAECRCLIDHWEHER